jgi:hypothetical protein
MSPPGNLFVAELLQPVRSRLHLALNLWASFRFSPILMLNARTTMSMPIALYAIKIRRIPSACASVEKSFVVTLSPPLAFSRDIDAPE